MCGIILVSPLLPICNRHDPGTYNSLMGFLLIIHIELFTKLGVNCELDLLWT